MWGITWSVIDGISHNHICDSQNGTYCPKDQMLFHWNLTIYRNFGIML